MKVSTIKIIKSDYLALLSLIAPVVMIVLFIDSRYFDSRFFGIVQQLFSRSSGRSVVSEDSSFFFIMAIATICIFVPLLIFRIKNIHNHFNDGVEVIGKIIHLSIRKDQGRVEYEYEIDGEKYRSGNAVHKSKFVNSLAVGQEVTIIVSKNNPKKGLIKEMYVSE